MRLAVGVVVVGVIRVIFGESGWDYYVTNHAFWGKMGAFVVMGLDDFLDLVSEWWEARQ